MAACWSVCQVYPTVRFSTTDCFAACRALLHLLSSGAWTPSSLSLVFCNRNALIQLPWIFSTCLVHFPACTMLTPLRALGSLLWEVDFQVKTQLSLAIKTGRLSREMTSFTSLWFFWVTPSRPGLGQFQSTHCGTLIGWAAQRFILCECWRHYSQMSISKQLSLLVRKTCATLAQF